jgi:cell division protein FtsW (lipid II flippase)
MIDALRNGKGFMKPKIPYTRKLTTLLIVFLWAISPMLAQQVKASDLPDDPYLADRLVDYFPSQLRERYADRMADHRLRRDIIGTVVVLWYNTVGGFKAVAYNDLVHGLLMFCCLLLLPIVPGVGFEVNGARLWVDIGPLRFQPGELAKIMLIVFLAGYLREKREVLAQFRLKDLGPLFLIWGGAMLVLVVTNDLGGGLLYFGIFLAMLYVATAQVWFVAAGAAMFVGGAALVYTQIDRVAERVRMWLDPWSDADGGGYQTIQSIYSIANGHFGGTGFGQGTFTDADGNPLIPHVSTDFIYSALAQELGLVGISAFLLVYMLFAARGFRIAMLAQDGFSKLLAVGLTFCFTLQTFIIVGGIVRIVPLTGITLPFVSYGGSSIVANFVLLAMLLLVSNRANARSGVA